MTNELRLGNIVQSITGVWLTVIQVSPMSIMYDRYDMEAVCGNCPHDEFKGIPLTTEILEQYGFELQEDNGYDKDEDKKHNVYRNRISIAQVENSFRLWVEIDDDTFYNFSWAKVDYLHQLQNLYFALTASELPVNLQLKKA